MISTGSLGG